ncbi:hypothetical protein QFC20_005633 [Naganishia adeliensis]|uniref:Uncharacterized protein n=1 Tax=Naganishia adeliensis TaxID=92952 RepID=A0ACC2VJW9_9TREE|nr:hypothetical protein QFC20_005633 [Naganishia adeliensis]
MFYPQYSRFEVISSVVALVVFIAIVVGVFYIAGIVEGIVEQQKAGLRAKGVVITRSGVTIQTARVAPSREEVISSTQRAFENSAAKVAAHKDAFRFGDDSAAISNVPLVLDAEDGTDTPDASAASLSRNPTASTYRNTAASRGVPPPGSAAAEGLKAAHGQGMTTSFGAVRGDGTWNEGQVPVGEGEAVGPSSGGDGLNSKRSMFRRHKKAAV